MAFDDPPPQIEKFGWIWRRWIFNFWQNLGNTITNWSLFQNTDPDTPTKYRHGDVSIAPGGNSTISRFQLCDYPDPDMADNVMVFAVSPTTGAISVSKKDLVITAGEDEFRRIIMPSNDLWLGRYCSIGNSNPNSSNGLRISQGDVYALRIDKCDPSAAHQLIQGETAAGKLYIGTEIDTAAAECGRINFRGQSDAANTVAFAALVITQDDVTDAAEEGSGKLISKNAGANATQLKWSNGIEIGSPTGGGKGKGVLNIQGSSNEYVSFNGNVGFYVRSSNPEGNQTANDGSILSRDNSSSDGNGLWFKDNGTGDTGWISLIPIGSKGNQTWSLYGGRAFDTDYENTKNMAIEIKVGLSGSAATAYCGLTTGTYVAVGWHDSVADTSTLGFIVQPGSFYKVTQDGTAVIEGWSELR